MLRQKSSTVIAQDENFCERKKEIERDRESATDDQKMFSMGEEESESGNICVMNSQAHGRIMTNMNLICYIISIGVGNFTKFEKFSESKDHSITSDLPRLLSASFGYINAMSTGNCGMRVRERETAYRKKKWNVVSCEKLIYSCSCCISLCYVRSLIVYMCFV